MSEKLKDVKRVQRFGQTLTSSIALFKSILMARDGAKFLIELPTRNIEVSIKHLPKTEAPK